VCEGVEVLAQAVRNLVGWAERTVNGCLAYSLLDVLHEAALAVVGAAAKTMTRVGCPGMYRAPIAH